MAESTHAGGDQLCFQKANRGFLKERLHLECAAAAAYLEGTAQCLLPTLYDVRTHARGLVATLYTHLDLAVREITTSPPRKRGEVHPPCVSASVNLFALSGTHIVLITAAVLCWGKKYDPFKDGPNIKLL